MAVARKNNYLTTVYFLCILHLSRGKFSKIILKYFFTTVQVLSILYIFLNNCIFFWISSYCSLLSHLEEKRGRERKKIKDGVLKLYEDQYQLNGTFFFSSLPIDQNKLDFQKHLTFSIDINLEQEGNWKVEIDYEWSLLRLVRRAWRERKPLKNNCAWSSRGHFSLAVYFRVTFDGLSEIKDPYYSKSKMENTIKVLVWLVVLFSVIHLFQRRRKMTIFLCSFVRWLYSHRWQRDWQIEKISRLKFHFMPGFLSSFLLKQRD